MASAGAVIIGDKALQRNFDSLGKRPRKGSITKAMRPAAKVYQRAAKQMSPKDSGGLQRSIKIKVLRGNPPVLSVRPEYKRTVSEKTGRVTAGMHAHLVEFGTGRRPAMKDGQARVVFIGGRFVTISHTGSMPGSGFLAAAFRSTEKEMERSVSVEMWNMVTGLIAIEQDA